MAVLPVHAISSFVHLADESFSAGSCFPAVQHGKCYVLHIAFDLPQFRLLQELVRFFRPGNRFLPDSAGKRLSLFWYMQSLFPALLIATFFQFFQVLLAPLELAPVLIVDRIDYDMGVGMPFIGMGGYEHFMPFPRLCMLYKLDGVLMCLFRGYMLVLMVALYEVLVSPSASLSPQLLGGSHFILYCVWFAVQAADKLGFCLFLFRHIIQCLPYACF